MLDTYFKQYFWTFHLLVIALGGFLIARMANTFIAESLRLSPDQVARTSAKSVAATVKSRKSSVPTRSFLERNMFNAEREDLTPEPEPSDDPSDSAEVDVDNCDKTTMRLNLVATVVTSVPDRSLAVFTESGKGQPKTSYVGERLEEEATILSIEWRRVLVEHNGRCEYFSLEEEAKKKGGHQPSLAAQASTKKGSGKPKMDLGKGVKKTADGEYEIPSGEIDNVLGNLSVIATQARIVPSFQNGKPNGFKLFSIRPGSLYSKIGIQNGDIVQKINGYEINSPDKALEIYSKLKDAASITVDLVRRGRQKTMTYSIR